MSDGTSTREPLNDKSLARVIAAIGKATSGLAERAWFENWFRALKQDYRNRLPGYEADVKHRDLLRKLLVNIEERRELRRKLEPFEQEFAKIRRIKLSKITGLDETRRSILMGLTDPITIAHFERNEEEDIRIFLGLSDDYRKDPIRKLAVEPFLTMLRDEGVVPTRELPLNRMVEEVLDYLGIDPKRRPTSSGIRTIAHEVERDVEKSPARHPEG